MKLLTAKACLWGVTLAISTSTVAEAQISPAQGLSAMRREAATPAESAVADAIKPLESPPVATGASSPADLPDAPSAIAERMSEQEAAASPGQSSLKSPATSSGSIGPMFLAANGALFFSTIANVELIAECRPTACQAVPDAIRSRPALYGIGIPASLGISYISYRLKRAGTRMWIVPVAVFTAGNIVYAIHAAHFSGLGQ